MMKIQAQVKDPGSALVELKIEMTMDEWGSIAYRLDSGHGVEGPFYQAIISVVARMKKVVRAEEDVMAGSQ